MRLSYLDGKIINVAICLFLMMKGNSAFETAQALSAACNFVHVHGRSDNDHQYHLMI